MIEKGERAYLVLHIKEPRKGEDGGACLDSEEPNDINLEYGVYLPRLCM